MPGDFSRAGILPTPQQELLLKVLLLEGAEWPNYWREWSSKSDIDTLDNGSYSLLPMLYKKLEQKGLHSPNMSRFKGVYRKNWLRNHHLFHQAEPALGSLYRAGIPVMLLKGAALILDVYGDFGLRTMRDIDLLVPTRQFRAAISILHQAGWRSGYSSYPEYEESVNAHHALTFMDSSGYELDLHRHALYLSMDSDADDDFWTHATPTMNHDIPCRVMNPSDQLLHVLVHGAQWNPVTPLRWVADAMCILRRHPGLDWQSFVRQAEKRQLVLQVRDTTDYLASVFAAPVPEDVRDRLRWAEIPRSVRSEYQALIRPISRAFPVKFFWAEFRRYRKWADKPGVFRNMIGYGRVLQVRWQLKSLWSVPFVGCGRALRRIVHRIMVCPAGGKK